MCHSIHLQIMVDSRKQAHLWVIRWNLPLINSRPQLRADSKIWIWWVVQLHLAAKYLGQSRMLLLPLTVVLPSQAPLRSWPSSSNSLTPPGKWPRPTRSPPRRQTAASTLPRSLNRASTTASRARHPPQITTIFTRRWCLMERARQRWTKTEVAKAQGYSAKIHQMLHRPVRLIIRASSSNSCSTSTSRLRRTGRGLSLLRDRLKGWVTSRTMGHRCNLLIKMSNSSIARHQPMIPREAHRVLRKLHSLKVLSESASRSTTSLQSLRSVFTR